MFGDLSGLVPHQGVAIFLMDTGKAQAAGIGMAQVVDMDIAQPHLGSGVLPAVVVHGTDAVTGVGEHEFGMLAALRFDDAPTPAMFPPYRRTFKSGEYLHMTYR